MFNSPPISDELEETKGYTNQLKFSPRRSQRVRRLHE